MLPFQNMDFRNLPEMAAIFFMCWLIMGIPSLLALLAVSLVIKRFKFHQHGILKRVRFWTVVFLLPVSGLVFGAGSGWFEAWTYHHDSLLQVDQSWMDIVAMPGTPGDAMANTYGGDWQDDEAWDYRGDIAILDAMFWTSVAGVGVLVVGLVFHHGNRPTQREPGPPITELN